MVRIQTLHHAFNVGVYDRDKLHRIDVDTLRLAAEVQTNFIPNAAGRASPRPGTAKTALLSAKARPVLFDAGDNAYGLLLGNSTLQVCDLSTDTLVTRPAVSTAVQSGDFSASTGWTLNAAAGQSSTVSGGALNLAARARGATASAVQQVTVAGGDIGVEHALRIVVTRGPVLLRVGMTSGGQGYVQETELRTGTFSIAFTPTGNFYVQFASPSAALKLVDSCTIEAAGTVSLPTPWPAAAQKAIRRGQSLDVMFCACAGYHPQRIERRNGGTTVAPIAGRSWGVCNYDFSDGPFDAGPNSSVTLTPSAFEGNGTLTASANFFTANHVGAIFRLFHDGQAFNTYIAAENQYTDPIIITGITETNFEERKYTYTLAGTWAGTVRNRRSYTGDDGSFHDYRRAQTVATIDITANATYTNDDNDDNIDMWVKIGIPPGLYTSGEVNISGSYPNGGGFGICRVVGYTSATQVDIEILTPFKGTNAVADWRQGRYDAVNGWPSAVAFDDGRLVWFGTDKVDASISDAYEAFDENFAGDSGPLSRAIALGGRNQVQWALPLSILTVGCNKRVVNGRASSLDEVITPDNFGVRTTGAIGAAALDPIELADERGLFVEASGVKIYEIVWDPRLQKYSLSPFTKLTTDLFAGGIGDIALSAMPDQRIWVANTNADATCIVFEPTQEINGAHIPISTSTDTDFFEYFMVAPGTPQDRVYAVVRRVVNGSTSYLLEKFALDTEARVDTVSKCMDSHVTGTGAHSATITGLDHLEGRSVVAWVDGAPVLDATITDPSLDNSKVFTVVGGSITLPVAPTAGWCVGLAYDFKYKSSRLAYGVDGYSPMLKNKSLAKLGFLLADYVRSGVRYGAVRENRGAFSTPWSLPALSSASGDVADEIVVGPGDDEVSPPAGSELDLDIRFCIAGRSPKPFSMLSLVLDIEA